MPGRKLRAYSTQPDLCERADYRERARVFLHQLVDLFPPRARAGNDSFRCTVDARALWIRVVGWLFMCVFGGKELYNSGGVGDGAVYFFWVSGGSVRIWNDFCGFVLII